MTYGVHTSDIENLINRLFSSIILEQRKYNSIKPADSNRRQIQNDILDIFKKNRGIGLYYDYISTGRGHGPFTELVDGSVKYDLIGSMGINILGHSHPLVIRSHLETATCDTTISGNLLPHSNQAVLTKRLLETVTKSRLKHFWFAGSGSFANDLALKLLWQKSAPRRRIIAFEKAFAGRSIASQNITWNTSYREDMPSLIDVDFIPHFDQSNPDKAVSKTLRALDKLYKQHSDEYCALIIELVQGEAGFVFGTKEYYRKIFEWARQRNIFIWIDEIQTVTRTHELFAFQMFELDDYVDVVTIRKTLQCCGVFYTSELNPKPGLIGGTFAAPIVSLNLAHKMLEYFQKGNFHGPEGRVVELEKIFLKKIEHLSGGTCSGKISYFGGIGTMISFEIGDSSEKTTWKFLSQLFNNGIIAFSAGKNPTRVRFLLPLSLTKTHIDEIFTIIEKTINQVI